MGGSGINIEKRKFQTTILIFIMMFNSCDILKSKKLLLLAGVFILATSFISPIHRFYLSLTEIHIDTKKHTLDVTCKLFTDDLEEVLLKKYGKKVDLSTSAKNKEVQALVYKYISENFKINTGGKLQTLTFVGFETETDATWCYLETTPYIGKGRISVMNSLLYDYLPEESNMMNIYVDDAEKSAKLANPEKLAEFDF